MLHRVEKVEEGRVEKWIDSLRIVLHREEQVEEGTVEKWIDSLSSIRSENRKPKEPHEFTKIYGDGKWNISNLGPRLTWCSKNENSW